MANITLIGFGHMGRAFYYGLKNESDLNITALNRTAAKVTNQGGRIASATDLAAADYILLGIKPQDFAAFKVPVINTDAVIISMVSGITIEQLADKFKNKKIVRCMPNLCIKNKNGVIGWYGQNLNKDQQDGLDTIFSPLGMSLSLPEEKLVDNITLISGSGPGYLAYCAQILEQNAVELGFSKQQAETLVTETFAGTTTLLQQQSAQSLADEVSSPGGVTAAITETLKQANLAQIIYQALNAGAQKIKDLKN